VGHANAVIERLRACAPTHLVDTIDLGHISRDEAIAFVPRSDQERRAAYKGAKKP
jgi:hypothetical protein